MNVTLPWPSKVLHPNARQHWATVAKAKKAYRRACFYLTCQAGLHLERDDTPLMSLTFYPPDRRHRDLDGMLSAAKSGLDGVADAIGCDDSRWSFALQVSPEIGGMIKLEVSV